MKPIYPLLDLISKSDTVVATHIQMAIQCIPNDSMDHACSVAEQTINITSHKQHLHLSIITALLHDSVEDNYLTLNQISDKFGNDVTTSVDIVTRKQNQSYSDYIDSILNSNNAVAITVKKADLIVNMTRTLDSLNTAHRRIQKYGNAIQKFV